MQLATEQDGDPAAHIVIRIVGDLGLHQNVGSVPQETVHHTAEEVARRLMATTEDGRIEIEINGEFLEPELISYWRMLASEALSYPGEFDQLVRSIERDLGS